MTRARRVVELQVPPRRRGPGWDRHWRELEAYLETPGDWSDEPVSRSSRDRGQADRTDDRKIDAGSWRRQASLAHADRSGIYSLATHAHCNWSVSPTGTFSEIAAIERLVDDVRMSHAILAER